jgi:hypothetical protein
MVLFPKPQLSGSLSLPSIHELPSKELAGSAQLVKSALIWGITFSFGLAQRFVSATILPSLCANWACYIFSLAGGSPARITYTCSCAHWARVCIREAAWRLGILYYSITYYCSRESGVKVGSIGEVDVGATKDILVPGIASKLILEGLENHEITKPRLTLSERLMSTPIGLIDDRM